MATHSQPRLRNDADTISGTSRGARGHDGAYRSLRLAQRALTEAMATADVSRRYACAHVAALRVAAAVLAVRAHPTRRPGQRNAWELLVRVAPELTEWATLFASCARKRAAAEAGLNGVVTAREADDQIRDAERFLCVVAKTIGIPAQLPIDPQFRWQPANHVRKAG